jgi:SAM-dependent methyltransferase
VRVSVIEGHRLWAPTYDAGLNPLLALETRVLAGVLCPIATKCFVEVACGTGRWMAHLCERGGSVFGADFCSEMLAQASRKPLLKGRLVLAEAMDLPFRNRIADVALCSFAAGYFSSLGRAVSEMARVTKRGGRVIISDLHPAGVAAGWTRSFRVGPSVYEMEHSAFSLHQLREAGQQADLHLQMQLETCLGNPERPLFRTAGKEHIFAEMTAVPAVWIGVWKKP